MIGTFLANAKALELVASEVEKTGCVVWLAFLVVEKFQYWTND